LIDRLTWLRRPPRRFEVAVFEPDQGGGLQVKRILGLPDENIDIRNGELLIEGKPLQKNLRQQRGTAILVHDDRFRPPPSNRGSVAGWEAEDESGWVATENGWRRPAEAPHEDDWLTFTPLADGVYDDYSYNASVSRTLYRLDQLMLTCDVATAGSGSFWVRVEVANNECEARFTPEHGQLKVVLDSTVYPIKLAEKAQAAIRRIDQGAKLVVSTIDQQLLIAVEDVMLAQVPLDWFDANQAPPAAPFALRVEDLTVDLSALQVWRDIHYTEPPHGGFEVQLPEDGYFVLGDNSPVSIDSRHPENGAFVRANQLLGRVLRFRDGR